jgi:two-component system response regulator DesR
VIRVLLIEDRRLTRRDQIALLAQEPDIQIVGQLGLDPDIAPLAVELWPNVVLIDTDYMVSQVLPTVAELKARIPGCAVLILSDPSKVGMLPPRRRARGLSFVVRGAPVDFLADTIRRVAAGERVIQPRLILAAMSTEKNVNTRELEILGLAAEGAPVAEIARRLYLSLGTVRNYLSAVITKTGARNRNDAIRILRKDGWLR